MSPKCSFGGRLLSLCRFSLLHQRQSLLPPPPSPPPPPPCLSTMLRMWMRLVTSSAILSNVTEVVLTAPLFLRTLLFPCGPLDQNGLNHPLPCWSSLAFIAGYGRGEPDHLQSPRHQDGSKDTTEFRSLSWLCISSTPRRWPVEIGRATADILVSLLSLSERHLSLGEHEPLCMSFHCWSV